LSIQGRKTSVAVISKADSAGGGASRVAEDLSKFLNDEPGTMSHHWLGWAGGPWEDHYRKLYGGRKLGLAQKVANRISTKVGFPDFFTPEMLVHQYRKEVDYDIYHFHDTSGTFSPIAMRWLGRRKPVVWTFHDCSPFTGGCLYPLECKTFGSGCGSCPQLDAWPLNTPIDATRQMFRYKHTTAVKGLYIPIAPSNWMADMALKSGMFAERPRVIPYCVDTDLFRPLPKKSIRDALGLPRDRFILTMSVHSIEDPRKGIPDALAAIEKVSPAPLLVAMGSVTEEARERFRNIDALFLGYVSDRKLMAQYYAAADALLFPTYADNLPNSVLEALACGTPTIGYDTGGMCDMVEHNSNGWLAPTGKIDGLSEGIRRAQSNSEAFGQWAQRCRVKAERDYSRAAFMNAHLSLYESLLDRDKGLLPHLEH